MDDGKCLLDVISDPQALKEFFRSPSQIGFVDSETDKKGNNINTKPKQENIQSDTPNYVVSSTSSSINLSQSMSNAGGSLQQQQQPHTKPLGHFSYTSSGLKLNPTFFTTSTPLKNGQISHVNTTSAQASYVTTNESTGQLLNRSIPQTKHVTTTVHNLPSSLSKEQSFVNTPISFAFGDPSKARNILSGTSHVAASEKPISAQNIGVQQQQQLLGHNVQLKQSPPKLISNISPTTTPSRVSNLKGSPLAPLRPKKIVPRPIAQQNVTTVNQSDQAIFASQGVKGKMIAPGKTQPLVAIQPKLIITSQANQNPGGVVTQAVLSKAGNLPIGSKLQVPVQNQALNSLLMQQGKAAGIQNVSQVGAQSKVTNLVQLQVQPKQIAPKPGQTISFQTNTSQKINQEHVQQQLVQSLLAKTQQKQPQSFVVQRGSSTPLNDDQQNIDAQNQLKELLQRNQMLQQVIQTQRLLQQQQQQQQSPPTVTSVQASVKTEQSQASPLQSLMNSTVQHKVGLSAGQTNNAPNSALNASQLQQFLEKNPLVAQQLKQINLKQGINNRVVTTTTMTSVPNTKGTVSIQRVPQLQPTVTTQITMTTPKKIVVAATQPQATIVNQTVTTEQKVPGAQKVLLVQQSPSGGGQAIGQPRILLQTKDGKPILLTQEQFKQIQQQLASKNLAIQAKLVTTTSSHQVVVRQPEHSSGKSTQKASATTPLSKQDISKGIKRPVKAVETPESKLIKRMKLGIQKDQNDVSCMDIHKPFQNIRDAVKKLVPFHVFSEPEPNAQMKRKANFLLDKLATQLTNKSDRMINKYRQLLLGDMQRDVPSAEVVMVNRIFLADEKAALMNEKKMLLEEVRNTSKSTTNNLASTSITIKQENQSSVTDEATINKDDSAIDYLINSTALLHDGKDSPASTSESQSIDIMDNSPSPMASANTFLVHLSTNNLSQRTNYTPPEPS